MIKFLKFIPVQLVLFLVIGILVGSNFYFQPGLLVKILSSLIILLFAIYIYTNRQIKSNSVFTIIAFILIFFIGISTITFKNQLYNKQHYTNISGFKPANNTIATIAIKKVLKPTLKYNKYEAEVVQLLNTKSIGSILVNIEKDSSVAILNVGDNIVVSTSFYEINKPLNPYVFNYKKYLKNKQIYHQLYVNNTQFLKQTITAFSIKGLAAKFRDKVIISLKNNGFKDNELAVVNALLLGQRQTISKDLIESYSDAGAIHILAVSGLHIGIILLILTFLLKPLHYLKYGKLISSIIIVCLLWMYAIIAGLSPSVVRAVTMFTAIAIGMYLNKASNIYNTLVISMFFLLLFNPYYLFDVGFQLSYLAVFAIVWIQPKIVSLWSPKNKFVFKMWQLFAVSLAAQLGVLPLSIFYFHQFPGLFFLSNLVIIPFLGFILITGIVVILLSVFELLPQVLADIFIHIIRLMNAFVKWIASQDFFIIKDIALSMVLMCALYVVVFLTFKWIEKKMFSRLILVLLAFISVQIVLIFEKNKLQTTNEFIVFNENRTTVLASRFGTDLNIYSSTDSIENLYSINAYVLGSGLKKTSEVKSIKNLYRFKNETVLLIDSLGMYNFKSVKPSIILLQNSPKINLDRLLKIHQPKMLVVDASNYRSYVNRWEETCIKNKTPFYNTMQKGAFILKE
ncbi:ComEC family competence protein [Lutibacter sp. A80]|uniref:ComEC/Rec2 family competence protein n=1 Tax=Lutibacter sp. A80 TaxID=2918453 RepID=UPI001F06D825|nr:ComEC/Rec2 family competence protein [Lutibacter sp. A80]UMB60368.1 ComEC family competence protein [Lutibacter sp. A80]